MQSHLNRSPLSHCSGLHVMNASIKWHFSSGLSSSRLHLSCNSAGACISCSIYTFVELKKRTYWEIIKVNDSIYVSITYFWNVVDERSSVISHQMGFLETFHSILGNLHSKLEKFHRKLEKFDSKLIKFHSDFVKTIRLFSNP